MSPEEFQKHLMRERFAARRYLARTVVEARKELGLHPETSGTMALRRPRNRAEQAILMEEINQSIKNIVNAYRSMAQKVLKVSVPAMKKLQNQFTLVATLEVDDEG